MAQKIIYVPEIGEVTLQKKRASKNIRLTVGHDGHVRVSLPIWSPYGVGEAFVRTKITWIQTQKTTRSKHIFQPGERIGKAHRLRFVPETRAKVSSRVTQTQIIIRIPHGMPIDTSEVQTTVEKAALRALRMEAKQLLPDRLKDIAKMHGFSYRSVAVKRLKTRWGSCTSQKDITLNCYLMQLPWELIDYVILHELMHTRIMAHGPQFWDELGRYVHGLPEKRKTIRIHQPALRPQG